MATASRSSSTEYRTTDLVLASYLCSQGFPARAVRVEGEQVKPGHPQGAWVFPASGQVQYAVSCFEKGEAKVEPKLFHTCVTDQRRRMFKFLGIGQ